MGKWINMGAYQLLLGEAVVKKLLVEDLGDDTWQNRV
jgi:hypothetical protein